MKHLRKFETESAYNTAKPNLILPNVSLIAQTSKVEFNGYGGHGYVDLGLPSGTKWATMNVGATSETDYGKFYAYGLGAEEYTDGSQYYNGNEDPLAASADTAVQVWGGPWHMPHGNQFLELTANTTYTWETNFNGSGVNGGKFTAQNGRYVFFPAGGMMDKTTNREATIRGLYWEGGPHANDYAFYLNVQNGHAGVSYYYRDYGLLVRPCADR